MRFVTLACLAASALVACENPVGPSNRLPDQHPLAAVQSGTKITVKATLNVCRSTDGKLAAFGTVTLVNEGDVTTEGLMLDQFVQQKTKSAPYSTLPGVSQTIIPVIQVPARNRQQYDFSIAFAGVTGANYRLVARATITNFTGNAGAPSSVEAAVDFPSGTTGKCGPQNTPPAVAITAPATGSVFMQGTNMTFTGTASDSEDGDLSGSITWKSSIAANSNLGTGGSVSSSTLVQGTHIITASVTDAAGLTTSTSIVVRVNAPPLVSISTPANGSTFNRGATVTFTGNASDAENGDLSAAIAWSSSIAGSLGTGASISTSTLTAGTHTVTAAVTDNDGASASASTTITINACSGTPVPPGYTKTWTGNVSTDWDNRDNWFPSGAPASSDNVFICPSAMTPRLPALSTASFVNDLIVAAGASLQIDGPLYATGNVRADGGISGAGTLQMTGTGKTLQGSLSNLLVVGTISAAAAVNVNGNLKISGPASNLTINGQRITVTGDFDAEVGVFTMTNAADALVVGGRFNFDDALAPSGRSTEGYLTAGELHVAGDFQVASADGFVATGTRVVLDGTLLQNVTFRYGGSPTGSRFYDLNIRNPNGVVFGTHSYVSGTLNLDAPFSTRVSGVGGFTVAGDLLTGAFGDVSVATVKLLGAQGTAGVLGSFSPAIVEFLGNDQPIKGGLAYHNMTIRGTVHPTGSTLISGNLLITDPGANFTLNGQQVMVTGMLTTSGGAVFTMNNPADLLVIAGSATFNGGGNTDGKLTAGELRVAGNFTVDAAGNFIGTGTHKVVLNGAVPRTVSFAGGSSSTSNRFSNLDIPSTVGVAFTTNAYVSNNLDLIGQMTVNSAVTLTAANALYLRSTSLLNNNGTIVKGSCVKEAGATVNGTDPCPAANTPPNISITAPASGSSFNGGTTINFTGTASDAENGNLSTAISWSSNIDGNLGTGANISTSTLSGGTHTITAAVSDNDGASASTSITITINACSGTATPPGYTKTWTGAINTAWMTAGNWSPSGVPVSSDKVFICAAPANQPILGLPTSIMDLRVDGTLTLQAELQAQTVDASRGSIVDGGLGAGVVRMVGFGTVQGTIAELQLFDVGLPPTVSVVGPLNVGKLAITGLGANLVINGQHVTVAGDFVTSDQARFTMTNTADLLVIGGDAFLSGRNTNPANGAESLTAGEMRLAGDLFVSDGGTLRAFVSTGTHKVVLNGSSGQIVFSNVDGSATGNRFNNLDVTNPAGVIFATASYVSNNLDLVGQMTVNSGVTLTAANTLYLRSTSVLNNNGTILEGSCVKEPGATVNGTDPCAAPNATPTVSITAPTNGSSFNSGTTINFTGTASDPENGDLSAAITWSSNINGSLGTGSSVSTNTLSVGTHTITAAVTDSDGASGSASITITIISVAPGCSTPTPSGYTKTWTGATTVDWATAGNWSPSGVPTSTDNVFICAGPANQPTLAASTTIDDLLVDAGASLSIVSGTLTASGNVTAGNTITGGIVFMTGVGKTVRGTVSNLTVAGSISAAGTLNVMGDLRITGTGSNLTINGQQVTVTGAFQTDNSAVFTMSNAADLFIVGGNTSLSGASTDGKLTAGELRVAGDFLTGNVAAFIATGTHKTVLNGNTTQTVSILNPGPSAERFLNLDISNTAGVTFATMVQVGGNLNVVSAVALTGPFGFTAVGDLSTVVGSSVSVGMVRLQGGLGTTGVLGSFSPGTTEFLGNAQPIKGGLSYQYVTIRGTAQPDGPTAMSGDLTIRGAGANLTINGQQVTVTGSLSVDNIAVLTMTNAADLLVIGGAASFSGLATDTHLTAGELRIAGNLSADIDRFVGTGSHKVVLNGNAAQTVLFANSSLTGNRFFNLNITNTAGVTFAANNNAYIGNNLDLTGQMTVSSNVTLAVENTLFLRSTSVLNNNGTILKGSCVKEAGATVNGTNPCP